MHELLRVREKTLRYIRRAMLCVSFVGLFASMYLLIVYLTDAPIVCGLLSGCERVRASSWAYAFGIPRPALGVFFYFVIIFLLAARAYAPSWRPRIWFSILRVATTIGFIESAFLTLIQWFNLRAFCLWCIISAISATILFFLSWFSGAEESSPETIVRELKFIFQTFVFVTLGGGIALWALLGSVAGGR